MSAPRLTAGYDDEPRCFAFPRADDHVEDPVDFVATAEAIARNLGGLCGAVAVVVEAGASPSAPNSLDWQVRDDGLAVGFGGGWHLAAALSSVGCGGVFAADEVPAASPNVARARRRVAAAVRAALGDERERPAGWSPCAVPGVAAVLRFTLAVAGIDDDFDLAAVAPARALPSHWQQRLRDSLDALALPVRIVLHDGPIAIIAARALSVGDVLPIATADVVALRIGTSIVARGRIDDSGDAPRIQIVSLKGRP